MLSRSSKQSCSPVITPIIVGLASTVLSIYSTASLAQGSAILEEIVVTAQKRAQNLQDVAATVSAFSGDTIDQLGWSDVAKIDEQVSGMFFGDMSANRPRVFIRGVGTTKFDIGSETGVAVFVDDVYVPRFSSVLSGLVDVERIEVLKGPQGTLYGRNVTGGAIKIINKRPTEEFEGFAELGVGNYDTTEAMGMVSGTLVDNKVLGRLAFSYREKDGPLEDTVTGRTNGGDDTLVRGQLSFPINDELEIGLGLTYVRQNADAQLIEWDPNPADPQGIILLDTFRPEIAAARDVVLPATVADDYSNAYGTPGYIDNEIYSFFVRANWSLDEFELFSITAYADDDMASEEDFDYTIFDTFQQNVEQDSEVFSQELRLASVNGGLFTYNDKLQWQVGIFYFKDDASRSDLIHFGDDGLFQADDTYAVDLETTSVALFGEANYQISDALTLTLGLRQTEEDKEIFYEVSTPTFGMPPVLFPFSFDDDLDFSSTDYKLAMDYQFTDEVMGYVSYSKGFKSGGIQFSVPIPDAAENPFDEEVLKSFEVGVKSRLMGGRVQLNVSAYRYDYEDQQVINIRVFQVGVSQIPVVITENVANSTMYGADVEAMAALTDKLTVVLNYSYLDATYDEYLQDSGADLSDNQMIFSPEHSYNIGVQYSLPLDDGEFMLRADYAWKDDMYFDTENTEVFGLQDSYGVVNFSGNFNWEGGRYSLTLFCDNCADEKYTVNKLPLPNLITGDKAGSASSYAHERQYGARFRVTF